MASRDSMRFDYDQLPTNPVDKSVDELLLTAASARSGLKFSKWLQSSRLRHKTDRSVSFRCNRPCRSTQ